MKGIYSCKLYKSSTRKNVINAALANPVNQPLVKQLREYLDDEYVTEEILEPEDNTSAKKPVEPSTSKIDESSKHDDTIDTKNDEGDTEIANSEGSREDNPVKSSITASLASISVIDVDSLKGTLNAVSDTAGVYRIRLDSEKKELWFYYNDNVNLNDIMTPVIELLEASNYYYLTFNRLARTDNAMVFVVSDIRVDTSTLVQPEGDDNE